MARLFEIDPIRRVAKNGTLEGIGLEWTEEASLRKTNRWMMFFVFVFCIPCALFSLIAIPYFSGPGWLGLIGFGWTGFYALYWVFGPLPRRSMIFMRDGSISVPQSIPGLGWKLATRHQADIANFEVGPARSGMQQDWTSSVQLVTGFGRTETISQKLHRQEARQIVVGLSLALKEMRVGVAQAPASSRERAADLID